MKKGQNYNRPKKGSMIKVQPIVSLDKIQEIKKMLEENPRDHCLFTMGINTNLRASDLLQIKVAMVKGKKPGQDIEIKEKKTGKLRRITLNKSVIRAIRELVVFTDYAEDDFLFKSQRSSALTVPAVSQKVKTWCKKVKLKGNYASHTLRKTWGYHQRVTFKRGLPELVLCFNHSTQRQTLDYLCIQAEELKEIYMNDI